MHGRVIIGALQRASKEREARCAMNRSLPFDCPRGLNRLEAARYVGVSPTTFDKLVLDGKMPRPKEVGARRVYDRTALDSAFDALGEMDLRAVNEWDA